MKLSTVWPALHVDREPLPARIEYERGVWGKVHGAPTDFRWIARSSAFTRDRADLHAQINLGGEDAPLRFSAWRSLGDRCCAIVGYPSRAIDASGRRGFLEKQVLEWQRPPGVPAAVGALLLLPHVAALTDEIWWDRYAGELWTEPDLFLALSADDHEPIEIDEDALGIAIERGRQQLREAVSADTLAQLYEQFLSGRRPALLAGLPQPLPAEALAALLLPLPRDVADRISLGGWIPTTRPPLEELGSRWDVLVTPTEHATTTTSSTAREMAEALLATESMTWTLRAEEKPIIESQRAAIVQKEKLPPRPGLTIELEQPEPESAPILHELYAFAAAEDRRWIAPQNLKQKGRSAKLGERDACLLGSWIRQLQDDPPPYADKEQWSIKVDLLRSAAIVLVPKPSTVQTVGIPERGSRVPALLFGLSLEHRNQWDTLAALGEKALRDVLAQSANCQAPAPLRDSVRRWLRRWQQETCRTDVNVPALIADVLRSSAP